jgi:membrane protein YdbS with pleckstrin-like domain
MKKLFKNRNQFLNMKIKIGEDFRPAQELKTLYYLEMLLIFAVIILPWYLPVVIFVPLDIAFWISVGTFIFFMPFFVLSLVWIPLYYKTVVYSLTNNEITWKRGVWFRNTGIVPYNRITNVDVKQGPMSRMFGIASVKIQTAGYSGTQTKSEISIEGMKNCKELQDIIMGFVRGKKPVAAETYDEGDSVGKILSELVKIRKLLERKKK